MGVFAYHKSSRTNHSDGGVSILARGSKRLARSFGTTAASVHFATRMHNSDDIVVAWALLYSLQSVTFAVGRMAGQAPRPKVTTSVPVSETLLPNNVRSCLYAQEGLRMCEALLAPGIDVGIMAHQTLACRALVQTV